MIATCHTYIWIITWMRIRGVVLMKETQSCGMRGHFSTQFVHWRGKEKKIGQFRLLKCKNNNGITYYTQ